MTSENPRLPQLSWSEVCALRLERHALSVPLQGARPADIVATMCGAHAQILSAAELSIGLRIVGISRAAIQHALWTEHSLIKTFGPRGTVHLLAARDVPLWISALSAVPSRSGHTQDVRLTPEQTEAVVEAIAHALAGAELTVEELGEAVVARTGSWAGDLVMPAFNGFWPRWRQAIGVAAHQGILCFGPNRGNKVTYTNPRRWLPDFKPAEKNAALASIVKSYLHAYGPATPQQFSQWLGAPRQWATDLFESLSSELQRVEVEGKLAWMTAGDIVTLSSPPQGVRLLPYFDAYIVGCHPRDLLFPGPAAQRALTPSGQAGNYPVLLINGTVGGVWHPRRAGRKIEITVEPFGPLSATQRHELYEQVERIGQFLEGTPQLAIGPVTAGPHA